MKKQNLLFALSAGLAGLALLLSVGGCKVQDKGTPLENHEPTVWISSAPVDSAVANHYLKLSWAGNDGDGTIAEYRLFVDSVQIALTSATDTTMAFESPSNGQAEPHTFGVVAVDNEGRESARAERFFFTRNLSPSVVFDEESSVGDGQTVSPGFRLTLVATDPNPSLSYYSISLDNEHWTPWTTDSLFLFGSRKLHTSVADSTLVEVDDDSDGAVDEEQENGRDDDADGRIDEDTRGLYPDRSYVVAIDANRSGTLRVWARVKDAGDATSEVITREVTLDPALRPSMDSTVTGIYGTRSLYPDGSQYFQRRMDIEISFAFSASFEAATAGMVNSYRYQRGDSAWSNWIQQGELNYLGLPAGNHEFRLIGRDLAGNVTTDTMTYTVRLVEPDPRLKVVIVDESGDTGITPEDSVDGFYSMLFRNYETTVIDFLEHGSFLSPYDLSDAGLVMYHAEDRAEQHLAENLSVFRDYLSHGGRLMLSGWDVLRPLASGPSAALDTILTFAAGSFGKDYLKLNRAECTPFRSPTMRFSRGWNGVAPYPDCPVDTLVIHGLIRRDGAEQTWVFQPEYECRIIGTLRVKVPTDSLQAQFMDRPTAYVYDQSYQVALFGFPLYFVDRASARALMDGLADEMLTGLSN